MTTRVNIYLEDEFADYLRSQKPRSLSLSSFCAICIDEYLKSLDRVATIPAYRVGAGEELSPTEKERLLTEEINYPSNSYKEKISPLGDLGESVGRECEGTPRKPPFEKTIPDNLIKHDKLILEFFAKKPGEHNKNAWNRLINGLTGIYDLDGDPAVLKQLNQGIEEGWRSITLSNYQKYGKQKPKFQKDEPDLKHPAYKVWSAEELGYNAPTSNPILKDLI